MMDRVATGSTAEINAPKRSGSIGLDVSIRANPCGIESIETARKTRGKQCQMCRVPGRNARGPSRVTPQTRTVRKEIVQGGKA